MPDTLPPLPEGLTLLQSPSGLPPLPDGLTMLGGNDRPIPESAWRNLPAAALDATTPPAPSAPQPQDTTTVRVGSTSATLPTGVPGQTGVGALGAALAQGAVGGAGSAVAGLGEATAKRPFLAPYYADYAGFGSMSRDDRTAVRQRIARDQTMTPGERQYIQSALSDVEQGDKPLSLDEFAGKPPMETPLAKAGEQMQRWAANAFPVDYRREGLATSVARTVGGLPVMLGASAVGSVAGGPVGGTLGAAAVIWPQSYDATLKDALSKGASHEQADSAARVNALAQVAMVSLPVANLLHGLTAPLQDGLVRTLGNFAQHGVSFGSANAMGRFAQNYIASQTYNPQQPLMEGVGEAGLEGAIAGLVVPATGAGARGLYRGARSLATPTVSPELRAATGAMTDLAGREERSADPGASVDAKPTGPAFIPPGTDAPPPFLPPGTGRPGAEPPAAPIVPPGAPPFVPPGSPGPVPVRPDFIPPDGNAPAAPRQAKPLQVQPGRTRQNPAELPPAAPPVAPVAEAAPVAPPAVELPVAPPVAATPPDIHPNDLARARDFIATLADPTSEASLRQTAQENLRRFASIYGEDALGQLHNEVLGGKPPSVESTPAPRPDAAPPVETPPVPPPPSIPAETAAEPSVLPGGLESLDPASIKTDAARFQFKAGGDETGVTDRLQGVTEWNPMLAGTAMVWRDASGQNWIADGHQRLGLANRLSEAGQPDIRLNAFVLREADGVTAEQARAIAAAKNIAEGSGTPLDAAKIMREAHAAGRSMPQLPPRSILVRDGAALARLGDEAFGMAVNEVVPLNHAAAVGRMVADPAQQAEAMRVLSRFKPDNVRQAETIVQDMLNSGTEAATQDSLFGTEHFASSVVLERAKILDTATMQLASDRATMRTLVGRADEIQSVGSNRLDAEGNQARLTADEQAAARLRSLGTTRGPVSDELTAIARELKSGAINRADAGRRFLRVVRDAGPESVERRNPDGGGGRGDEGEGPVAGQAGFFSRRAPLPPLTGTDMFGVERKEPERRTPEPTIRNDPAQAVMPGMGPSAVQAQAARDQTGRGTIGPTGEVRPANVGLFAPKPAERGPRLFSRRGAALEDDFAPEPPKPGETPKERTSREAWNKLILRNRVVRGKADAAAATGETHFMRLEGRSPILVSPSFDGGDGWRMTYFDKDGTPTGHLEYRDAWEAYHDAFNSGYEVAPDTLLSRRSVDAAASTDTPVVDRSTEIKARLASVMSAAMRHFGLPEGVGLKLLDDAITDATTTGPRERAGAVLTDAKVDAAKHDAAVKAAEAGDAAKLAEAIATKGEKPEAAKQRAADLLPKLTKALKPVEGDGRYDPTRKLIEFALNTPPDAVPLKLLHESIHALLQLPGLLTPGQRRALENGAKHWLERGAVLDGRPLGMSNAKRLRDLGYSAAEIPDEAIARMGEDALRRGLDERNGLVRTYSRLINAVRGIGQGLRGEGFRTANDVFRRMTQGTPEGRAAVRGALSGAAVPPAAAAPGAARAVDDAAAALPDKYFDGEDAGALLSRRDPRESPAFREWFGASKVVDAEGKPLTVYHGTREDFDRFSPVHFGDAMSGAAREGFFFTSDPHEASGYAAGTEPGGHVIPAYLSLRKPLDIPYAQHKIADTIKNDEDVAGLLDKAHGWASRLRGTDGLILRDIGGEKGKDLYVAFRPEQIKSAVGNRGTFDPADPRINYSRRDPTEETGMPHLYSAVGRVVGELRQPKGTGEQMLAMITKAPGVKPEEVRWLGLDTWLRGQRSVTREQISDYVRANSLQLKEVEKGADDSRISAAENAEDDANIALRAALPATTETGDPMFTSPGGIIHGLATGHLTPGHLPEQYRQVAQNFVAAHQATQAAYDAPRQSNPTRYPSYALPGGENYREALITLPAKSSAASARMTEIERLLKAPNGNLAADSPALRAEYKRLADETRADTAAYQSNHWDEPNVIAHTRFDERTAPDGRSVLMVHEVQSDWHQAGRKKGYGPQDGFLVKDAAGQIIARQPTREAAEKIAEQVRAGQTALQQQTGGRGEAATVEAIHGDVQGVPDAPFRTTWPMLVMKRLIAYAVDRGIDRIAWAPGEVQAARYDLSKQISRIVLHDNSSGGVGLPSMDGPFERGMLSAYDHSGRKVIEDRHVTSDELPDVIGKEAAERLLNAAPTASRSVGIGVRQRQLSGVDLRVGGEGMKGFYDTILPKEVQKLVGRFGAKVETSEIDIAGGKPTQHADFEAWQRAQKEHQTVHSFDVTPALRNAVEDGGLPLFSRRDPEAAAEREADKASAAQLHVALTRPGAKASVARRIADAIENVFSPTTRSPEAGKTERLIRRSEAEKALDIERPLYEQTHNLETLETASDAFDRMTEAEQLAFTDRREAGERQPTEALQAVADALARLNDRDVAEVRSLGKGHFKEIRKNYQGHIWANHDEWAAGLEAGDTAVAMGNEVGKVLSKGPIRGSGAFLKQRTFETQKAGMDAGLIPVTTNPIKMVMLKHAEVMKFVHGTRLADSMKAENIATWVPFHKEHDARAAGFVKLDDPVFQPKIRSDETYGETNVGGWYAPEAAAQVFNNFVSKGLSGNIIYDAIRQSGNAINQAQLGLSFFHAAFVLNDASISTAALGLEQVLRGNVARGLGNIVAGGTPILNVGTFIRTVRRGSQLRAGLMDPEHANPELRPIIEGAKMGGVRTGQQQVYRSIERGPLVRHMSDLLSPSKIGREVMATVKDEFKNHPAAAALTVPVKLGLRALETISEPLMGYLVPRAKLGVLYGMAEDWMRAHPDATPEQTAIEMTKISDSVDNRMGQLVYYNLFWKKIYKDLAMISARSVGWNLGTIRELGGAAFDTVRLLASPFTKRRAEFTHRMAYAVAMPVVVAAQGALLTYLFTGRGPRSDENDIAGALPLDYFFPPVDKDGENRVIIPSYVKDVIEYVHAPFQTLKNKTHPLASEILQLIDNQDYYGSSIYDSRVDNPFTAYAEFVLNTNLPFSLRGAMRQSEQGQSARSQIGSFFGFPPAPKSIVDPARGEAFKLRAAQKALRSRYRQPGRIELPGHVN